MARARWSGSLLAVGLAAAAPAAAEGPRLGLEGALELEDEWVFRTGDPGAELNDTFATLDLDASLAWPSGSGLYATVVAEPVLDAEDDRFFGDTGLYVEDLYLDFRAGEGALRAGKFTPVFGLVAEREPGLWGDELAGEYELDERIGVELALPYRAGGVEHVLTAAAFVADRTPLSDSLITSRGRLRLEDGGVSNTRGPRSFTLTSTGGTETWGYTLGIRSQAAGDDDEADEYGAVLGLDRRLALLGQPVALTAELAHFPRFDGEDAAATLLTLGGGVEIGGAWLTAYAGAAGGGAANVDRLATASVEVPLGESLSLAAGYRYLREETETHTLGLRLTYEFGFD